ncbi:MAG: outer membrane protein transport protein, partial [Synergistaceae bacterium]
MSLKKSIAAAALFILLAVPAASFAEGFGVYEWSPAGVAMGDNYMFGENDPSVLAYNPAAITRLDGTYFNIGATWVNPANNTTFSNNGVLNPPSGSLEWTNDYSPALLPSMFYATKAGKNAWWGIAIYSRFGNQIEYNKAWPGRYDTTYSGIKGVTVQPTFAWKMSPKLSAAVGVDINYMGLVMEKTLPLQSLGYGNVESKLDGTSVRVGGIFSLMYDFDKDTSAALVYRTKIKHTMDADMMFSNPAVKNTNAHGSVTLPDSITFGLGHKFNGGKTRVEFDTT